MNTREIDGKGWLLVLACMLGVAVCIIPVSILTMGVFIKPLGAAFGWGRANVSLGLTVLCLGMAAALPPSGRIIDRFGVKAPLIVSLILYAGCIALLPLAITRGGLAGFYLDLVVMGVVGAPSSTVAYVKIISGWFDRSRGAALGIAMCGIAVGASIVPVFAATVIAGHGWQIGFYAVALLPIVIGVPVACFVTEAPHVHRARAGLDKSAALPGMPFPVAVRTKTFAMLFLLFLIAATAIHGIQIHLAPLLSDRGFTPRHAALGVTFTFVISTGMRLITGFLFDRVFAPWVGAFCFLASALGTLLLLRSGSGPLGFVAVGLLGIGAGAESDLTAMLASRYFGLRSFATIYGAIASAFMIGSALGPFLLGLGFDASGSYASSLAWCTVGMLVTGGLLLSLPRFPVWATAEDKEIVAVPAAVAIGTLP
jgi:MFS family permease